MTPRAYMTRREADIFACLVDTVVAPGGPLPPVGQTDAVPAFNEYLQRSPAAGRLALRGALLALELGPRALGFRARLRRLSPDRRTAYLRRLQDGPLGAAMTMLRGLAQISYYGDERVMRLLGYDAAANVARGRALRAAEGRW
jgi:hypothetical protein